ncbi:MAG: ABC transporter ATP-binding protein, partial [Rhodothermales bacterium]|nr:ABC transporter ATP-binding protein [Rhodothermales bacterium]
MTGDGPAFVRFFVAAYPGRTAVLVVLLLLSGLAEGIGVAAVLPVLELAAGDAGSDRLIERAAAAALGLVGAEPTLGALLALVVLAMVAKGALRWAAMWEAARTVTRFATDLRLRLFRALAAARWSFFVRQEPGRFANAVGVEAHHTAWGYHHACAAFAAAAQAAVYLVAAVFVAPGLAALALVAGAVLSLLLWRLVRVGRHAGVARTASLGRLAARVAELLANARPLRAMGREGGLVEGLETEARIYERAERQGILAIEALTSAREPLVVGVLAVGLWTATAVAGAPFAVVLTLAFVFYRLVTALNEVQGWYQRMVVNASAFEALHGLIKQAEAAREARGGRPAPPLREGIALRDVVAGYGAEPALRGVTLDVRAGEFVVIVGPSGAGKSTLLDVLAGLVRPSAGSVLVDGERLAEVDLGAWRRQIGYVPQGVRLLHDTVLHNVTLGAEGLGEAEAERALRTAGAWGFVEPLGLDHVVGEGGAALSGGQAQRVLVARAIAARPRLLLLDEPTAALDPAAAAAVRAALRALRGE